jgi:hypothetical protein
MQELQQANTCEANTLSAPAGAVENWPAAQSVHDVAPAAAYRPDAHMAAGGLATVDAAGHAYPAAQSPVQVATPNPAESPYLPVQTNQTEDRARRSPTVFIRPTPSTCTEQLPLEA